MDQNSANVDLSSSQHAYLHVAVPAEDGISPAYICLFPRCGASFPAPTLLEAHAIVHANDKQTPNTVEDLPAAAGPWSAHTPGLHHDLGYPYRKTYGTPTPSLSGTIYNTPTGLYEPTHSLTDTVYDAPFGVYDPNPFNANGISDRGHIAPVGNAPSNNFTTINEGTFTQGYGHSAIASHDPYYYGHHQPMPAVPPPPHAVDQMLNTFNNTGPALARPTCVQCGRDFGRQSDLNRHMKKHQPDARVFRCQVHGCHYSSIREDKLKEHSRRPH